MIFPILRLVLIYFLLVAGVVAVFNRDKLAAFLPGRDAPASVAETAPSDAPPAGPGATGATMGAATDGTTVPAAQAETTETAPVFGDPSMRDTPAGDGARATSEAPAAPVVIPAPGIAPEMPPLAAIPAEDAVDTPDTPAFPAETPTGEVIAAPAGTETPAAPAPAEPGSHVPLGTPVASAPETDPGHSPDAAPPTALQAPEAPAAAVLGTPEFDTGPTAAPQAAETASAAIAEALNAVRTAYWSGDLEGARTQMDALAAEHPDNPDVAGELGNLAYALRDYPAAAEAWYRAGLLLIERGEGARVIAIQPILHSIAPDKAAELAARLQDR